MTKSQKIRSIIVVIFIWSVLIGAVIYFNYWDRIGSLSLNEKCMISIIGIMWLAGGAFIVDLFQSDFFHSKGGENGKEFERKEGG